MSKEKGVNLTRWYHIRYRNMARETKKTTHSQLVVAPAKRWAWVIGVVA